MKGWCCFLPPLKGHGKIAGIKHMFNDFGWDWEKKSFTKFGGRNYINFHGWLEGISWMIGAGDKC